MLAFAAGIDTCFPATRQHGYSNTWYDIRILCDDGPGYLTWVGSNL